jgi:hypothetical protein
MAGVVLGEGVFTQEPVEQPRRAGVWWQTWMTRQRRLVLGARAAGDGFPRVHLGAKSIAELHQGAVDPVSRRSGCVRLRHLIEPGIGVGDEPLIVVLHRAIGPHDGRAPLRPCVDFAMMMVAGQS